ncbi:MAG TPA: histidinol dehydrogenase [Gemmatimonadales bacterium]|nr:histidinol dehydrogenase [Gemmatimonadales bacterium]
MLKRLQAPPYDALTPYLPRPGGATPEVAAEVRAIVDDVRARRDAAVREHTRRLDGVDLAPEEWEVPAGQWQRALDRLPQELITALEVAIARVREYHRKQLQPGFLARDERGNALGMLVVPLERVGVYVPGGKAAYPSTVVMNVVPAVVAGVGDIVMVTPPGGAADAVLAAAHLAGVSRVFRLGGPQAVAALAFGTETVPPVDKIVGPGNKYVTEAKRQVAGAVGIDMLAGPTEVLVIADDTADVRHVAADLIAQAEHDEDASAWCVTTSDRIARTLEGELERQLARAPRRGIAEAALSRHGVLVAVPSRDAAVRVANQRAPEHLELLVENPWELVERIRHAGAVFVGRFATEPVGDYLAGPSHVLPTAGTARYVSPLGVYDFVKRISVIGYSREKLEADAPHLIALAEAEGLDGHAEAVRVRLAADR